MTLNAITAAANAFTDETATQALTMSFANEAIAKINAQLKTKLPYIDAQADYTALDEKWVRVVVIPYVAYSIKLNDGSLNEADRFLMSWQDGLNSLRRDKWDAIDEDYREPAFYNAHQIQQHTGWYGRKQRPSNWRTMYEGDE